MKSHKQIIENLLSNYTGSIDIMEVCGTHTMEICKSGISSLLPKNIRLISGPGCPVCVTPQSFIDFAIKISETDAIILTFGDMIKVKGSNENLEDLRAAGRDIRIIYNPIDSLKIARENKEKEVVLLGIGFETTTPIIALTIKNARELGIKNLSVLCGMKILIPALKYLCQDKELKIDGFLLPGHVSTIIGAKPYKFLPNDYNKACAIAGFEGKEILFGIRLIVEQIINGKYKIENGYKMVVNDDGNRLAFNAIYEVSEPCDSLWRGLGLINESGLKLRKEYQDFDAKVRYGIGEDYEVTPVGCSCGEIIKGLKSPQQCKLFGTTCTPHNPVGPCMISAEGSCAAHYKFSGG